MLLIWARVIILGYMAVNESNHWHKACQTPLGGAVPISTMANRATAGWRLHHQQQQQAQAFRKMANEEQDEATSLYICDELVMAQTRCTTAHSPSCCFFLSDGGDNDSNIVSFDFRVTIVGKNLEHAQNARSDPLSSTCTFSGHLDWVISGS